jgi:hypothetical protein
MTHAADTPYRHPRGGLVWPFVIVGLLLAVWTGWWFYLARQVESRLAAQAEALVEDGWTVDHARPTTTGWPFRARVSIPHVQVVAPSGHGIAAPELVAEANAWNPDRWVVVASDGLTLHRAGKGEVGVRAEALRLSVSQLRARFPDLRVQAVEPVFTPHPDADPFPIASAELIELYTRPHLAGGAASTDEMDVLFRLIDARGRPDGPVEAATRQGRLTAEVEATVVGASRLSGADAAGVFADWSEAGGRLANVRGELSAGESRARVESAALSADAEGRLVGEVSLSAERPMDAVAGLAGARSGSVNRVGAAEAAAAAAAAGDRPVDLVVRFEDGRTWLGPFALAPAPKLF